MQALSHLRNVADAQPYQLPEHCPRCRGDLARLISAPNLNRGNHSSPTEAKYSRMSAREEIARERILQKDYARIWLPPPVKHSPWEETD